MKSDDKIVLREKFTFPFPDIEAQCNNLTVHAIHVGKDFESVVIDFQEAYKRVNGELWGDRQTVRLFKEPAIATARAILKHFGEGLE